jgi:predicted nucleic acid-binding protein
LRVFADTNVIFAALATRGLCADLLRTLLADHDLVVGDPVIAELRRNLIAKLRMPAERADEALAFLDDLEHAPRAAKTARTPRGIDVADAAILECALRTNSEVFVTGDRALLALGSHGGMPIVTPRELWSRLSRT